MAKHEAQTTQSAHPWRATIRTVFTAVIALAALAPLIYAAAAQQSAELASGAAAGVLAVAGAVTRIMAVPGVEAFLQRFVPWLAAAERNDPPVTAQGVQEMTRSQAPQISEELQGRAKDRKRHYPVAESHAPTAAADGRYESDGSVNYSGE